ncbi:hypothetical protein T05_13432 [Trichinella murrelli]|uniref:Uncharacterized protein n=1 Tax=Trichinella murrelli TaxID=144512 RepID=A0A0V0T2Z5_9BILA|nr:hypothetical protein T05_8269 [Trichinella murrelli]KRX42062.1 hypothetical protein T05_13432 [Trichinella murrelli]
MGWVCSEGSVIVVYHNENQHVPALLHNKKKAQLTVRVKRPTRYCPSISHGNNWCACCQHRAVYPSIMWRRPLVIDRYDLHHEHEDHLLVSVVARLCVGIAYVQFYGAFIVQCPRPHLRQQRQQKMKKPDFIKSPSHS